MWIDSVRGTVSETTTGSLLTLKQQVEHVSLTISVLEDSHLVHSPGAILKSYHALQADDSEFFIS